MKIFGFGDEIRNGIDLGWLFIHWGNSPYPRIFIRLGAPMLVEDEKPSLEIEIMFRKGQEEEY